VSRAAVSIPRRAFTLVELLVVIVVIVLLIGITAPAFLGVRQGASRAATEATLNAVAVGIEQFEADHGFLPPLILDDPMVDETSSDWATSIMARDDSLSRLERERYHSMYSLAVYLVGIGELDPTEAGGAALDPDRHDGHAGPGFRDPGIDRAWGGARQRTEDTHRVETSGRIYGPYIDVAEGDRIRPADPAEQDFPEDMLPGSTSDGPWERMEVVLDGYGNPIRYYRYWPTSVPASSSPSLLDAPAEIVDPDVLIQAPEDAMDFPASEDPDLVRGEFVLLSAGPDAQFTPPGFARQGPDPTGWVSDFLELDPAARRAGIDLGFGDNLRVVR
jgi:prepilin-type N-terminal cleavage/methylation domain-containing protein